MSDAAEYERFETQRAAQEATDDAADRSNPGEIAAANLRTPAESQGSSAEASTPRLAVVVGHTRLAPGATGVPPIAQSEYHWNLNLAEMIVAKCAERSVPCRVFLRDGVGIEGAYAAVNAWRPFAVVELHFNAFNRKARGCEVLHGDRVAASAEYARATQNALLEVLGNPDRGLKLRRPGERGGLNVGLATCASILIEPFFGDQADDAALGHRHKHTLAGRIVDAFVDFSVQE